MFTGIVTDVGEIVSLKPVAQGQLHRLIYHPHPAEAQPLLQYVPPADSLACLQLAQPSPFVP